MLKHHIPIKTGCWDVDRPGFTEIDLVAHCGDSAEGHFANTLTQDDVFTQWVERRCVLGKSQEVVCAALDPVKIAALRRLRDQLNPFELSRIIERKLERIWAMRSTAPKPAWIRKGTLPHYYRKPLEGPPTYLRRRILIVSHGLKPKKRLYIPGAAAAAFLIVAAGAAASTILLGALFFVFGVLDPRDRWAAVYAILDGPEVTRPHIVDDLFGQYLRRSVQQ